MYCVEKPMMHLCQLARFVDTIMPLSGNKPSTSTTTQHLSSRRDNQIDGPCDQAQISFGGRRSEAYDVFARMEVAPADQENS